MCDCQQLTQSLQHKQHRMASPAAGRPNATESKTVTDTIVGELCSDSLNEVGRAWFDDIKDIARCSDSWLVALFFALQGSTRILL